VSAIYSPGRWARAGKSYRLLAWEGHFGDYREHSRMRIPFYGEVGWYVEHKLELVWKGRLENASYAFADGRRWRTRCPARRIERVSSGNRLAG
jgi:hypothetical protein